MAVLTADQLNALRKVMAKNNPAVTWTKANVNAALQAIEDRMNLAATRTALSNDIEAAAPGVFSAANKTLLFGVWCATAAQRLGVS